MDEFDRTGAGAGAQLFEELMRFLPEGMSPNAWAVKAGVSRTIWADLKRHGNPSRRTLEKLLAAAGSSLAEFEALRVGVVPDAASDTAALAERSRAWRGAPPTAIPLLATSLAGEWRELGSRIECYRIDRSTVVGNVDRPSALASDADAYALTMVGESMWPRFRAGRRLLVSPAATVAVGDDVLVQLSVDGAVIGELVRRTTGVLELRQFNPDARFAIETRDVVAIHKVVGEQLRAGGR